MERFELPLPPQGLVFPQAPQLVATVILWVLVAACLLYSLWEWRRTRQPLALLLTLGGAISYLNEPIDDVLGLLWHPHPRQWVAIDTFGPAPLWGLGIYTIFFGTMSYLLLLQARRGITRQQLWGGILLFFVIDLLCELPLLHYGLYVYYGEPPLQLLGLPLYWLFINIGGPLMVVALLLRAPQLFSGWRLLTLPLLPMTADAAGSIAAGWPIFSALNTPGASAGLKLAAALLTMGLGVLIVDGLAAAICRAPSRDADGRVTA